MPLTFLHTATRMMMDMMMIATKARTAANTATWEKRAVTGKNKGQGTRNKRAELIRVGRL